MGYRYEIEYSAWYEVESDEKLSEDEVISQAIAQHEWLPNGDWSIQVEEETVG
jgi:hypothetical protein